MKTTIIVCVKERTSDNPSCGQRGGEALASQIETTLTTQRLDVLVKRLICFGRCSEGPNVRIAPGGDFYTAVTPEQIDEIVKTAQSFTTQKSLSET